MSKAFVGILIALLLAAPSISEARVSYTSISIDENFYEDDLPNPCDVIIEGEEDTCIYALTSDSVDATDVTPINIDEFDCDGIDVITVDEETGDCVCIDSYDTSYSEDGAIVCTSQIESTHSVDTNLNEIDDVFIPANNGLNFGGGACSLSTAGSGSSAGLFSLIFAFAAFILLIRFRPDWNLKKSYKTISLGLITICLVLQTGCSDSAGDLNFAEDKILTAENASCNATSTTTTIEKETILVYPNEIKKEDPSCNKNLHQRIPYDAQGAVILRYNDLLKSKLVQAALASNSDFQTAVDSINKGIDTVLIPFKQSAVGIESIAIAGQIDDSIDIDEQDDLKWFTIIKFYNALSDESLDEIKKQLESAAIVINGQDISADADPNDKITLSKIDSSSELRVSVLVETVDSSESTECLIEAQFISCASSATELDQLIRVRDGEEASIQNTEKAANFNCNTIEGFIESYALINYGEFALETGEDDEWVKNTFGQGLFQLTLNVHDAGLVNSDDLFGYGKAKLSYYQDGQWDFGITIEISDRLMERFSEALTL